MLGGGHDGQGVAHVEFADEVDVKFEAGNLKLGRGGSVANIEGLHGVAFAEAEAFDRAMSHIEKRREVRVVPVRQQQAVAGHQPDEVFESGLDGFEIFKNVGVVEFEVVEDGRLGQVVDELAAFVEEGGVVFVKPSKFAHYLPQI